MTCFGVFWGILMLVILLGSGNGMKNAMFDSINGFSTNSAFIFADRTSESYKGLNKGRQWSLRTRDVENVRKLDGVESISPILWGAQGDKNVVRGELAGSYTVKGVSDDYFNIETQELEYGRLLNRIDLDQKRKVCLIGTDVNRVLFRGADPCGQYVRVNGIYYQVIGVTDQRAEGVNIGGRASETVFPSIWMKFSDDLLEWENSRSYILIEGRPDSWEEKIGGGAPPLKTDAGWLVIYHGVEHGGTGYYRAGALLLDLENPLKVLARTPDPILEPEYEYETKGFYSGCVFPTGNMIVDGTLYVYYGAADRNVGVATCKIDDLLDYLESNPV